MSTVQSHPDRLVKPDAPRHRRIERLARAASDLSGGAIEVRDLKALLAEGVAVPPAANLVKASADPIGHANVSAARALGVIVPGR